MQSINPNGIRVQITPSARGCTLPIAFASSVQKPLDKLFFPKDLVSEIGLCKHQIAFLKHKGCRFFGRKTTVRWVREFLNGSASGVAPSWQL
jgi:hypothetical protein